MKKIFLSGAGIAALVNLGAAKISTSPILRNSNNSATSVQEDCTSGFEVRKNVLLDRQPLTEKGFKSIYTKLINKPDNERKKIAKFMREDFAGFAEAHFVLSKNHIECLNTNWNRQKDVEFVNSLADFVEQGVAVATWDVKVPAINAPVGKKKRKGEVGYNQKSGFSVKFSIEF